VHCTKYQLQSVQQWDAIDNYMFRPSGGRHQVLHSEVDT